MAVKSFHVRLVVLVVMAVQAAYICGSVSSEKQTSDPLENNAVFNEKTSSEEMLMADNASEVIDPKTAQESQTLHEAELLPKYHKHHHHRRNHKTKKHHGKHRRRHEHSSRIHHQPSDASALPFSTKKGKPLGLYAQIATTTSLDYQLVSTPVFQYVRAYKAKARKRVKIAQIGKLNPRSIHTTTTANKPVTSSSLQPTQTTAGTPTLSDDPCTLWQNCALNQNANMNRWIEELPNCPCQFPTQIFNNSTLYDQELDKYFDWKVMPVDKTAILRRTAAICIRQWRSFAKSRLAAQVCCYDSKRNLITRGVGAGTPFMVSPDWNNQTLHFRLDVLPIRLCNGDWTRYHAVRPPNNGRNCTENPDEGEFARQVAKARDY